MAPPLNIDTALYRMKAYSGLLMASTTHEQKDIGQDIRTLVEWIEYARPLLGAVTTEAQAVNPFARHGLGSMSQYQAMNDPKPKNPDDDPDMPAEPAPELTPTPEVPQAPPEDKPAA